jgi:hypothetical protein
MSGCVSLNNTTVLIGLWPDSGQNLAQSGFSYGKLMPARNAGLSSHHNGKILIVAILNC